MNDTTPPPPNFPPDPAEPAEGMASTTPPAPASQGRSNGIIIGSAAAVIAAIIGTGIFVVQSSGDDSKPTAATKTSIPPKDDAAAVADEEEPEPSYSDPDADSFSIKLRTTDRQCFGSAGCNVTVKPSLTLLADEESIDPDAVYEITYEVRGDESGPVIATAELSEQTSLNFTPTSISTASAGTKVSVKITDVTLQG
ncbi:hypothetical protein ACYSUO_23240 [Streptomyces sp. UC4497]